MLRYDTVHGKCPAEVSFDEEHLIVDGKKIRVFAEKNVGDIPWGSVDAEIICECTGLNLTDTDVALDGEGRQWLLNVTA